MKIIVDINHPAHVHYFKNFIWEMERKGHEVLITATEKDVAHKLLDNYGFDYIKMGSYGSSLIKKLMNVPVMDLKMHKAVKGFKPDIFVGFGSIRAAHVSKLLRKTCITLEDTEQSKWENRLYVPFTDAILTPTCFKKDFGKKQIRYDGYYELAYLHPNYFKPDSSVLDLLGVEKNNKYVIMRFVAFKASHDIGVTGFTWGNKRKAVKRLSKYAKVFISSEGKMPQDLEKYRVNIAPEKLHDALYYASLYLGDSQTTTTEAACLGTPAIRCNTFACSSQERANFIELERKYGLIYNVNVKHQEKAIEKAINLLQKENIKEEWIKKREKLLEDKIDITTLMLWFIKNYPKSFKIMKKHPNYQRRFK